MEVPVQVTFKNLDRSGAVVTRIQELADRLERYFPRIISCRVTLTATHQRHHASALYETRIDLRVPGKEIVVTRNPDQARQHFNVFVSIRDAFDTAKRELENYAQKLRHEVKTLEKPPRGTILRLFYEDGKYGVIETEDGREVYFHSNSVLNHHFDDLEVGMEVRIQEEAGENGPQASTVELLSRLRRRKARS